MKRFLSSPQVSARLQAFQQETERPKYRILKSLLLTALAGLIAWGIHAKLWGVVSLLALPLALYGFVNPTEILVMTMALSPLTFGLTGDTRDNVNVIFSVSDVLYLFALPAVLRAVYRKPQLLRLGGLGLPALCYLSSGLISFALNVPAMHGRPLLYFSAWLRSAQVVFVVPLMFNAVRWSEKSLFRWLTGYLLCSSVLAALGSLLFLSGERLRYYSLLGMHKNIIGLVLSVALLIVLAGTIRPLKTAQQKPKAHQNWMDGARPWLISAGMVCFCGLAISLSRSSYLSLILGTLVLCCLRRRFVLLLVLLLCGAGTLRGVQLLLPAHGAAYMTDLSPSAPSLMPRLTMVELSGARFRQSPLFGDGYRLRREIIPHNVEVMVLVENGAVGGILFVWTLVSLVRIISSGQEFTRTDAVFHWFVLSMAVCTLAILTHAQFDPFWRRGPLWLIWAGGGAILSFLQEHRQRIAAASTETR